MIKANSDKSNLFEQKRASGFSEDIVLKQCDLAVTRYTEIVFHSKVQALTIFKISFREQLPTIKSYGVEVLFHSPWAKNQSDEEFFSQTLDTLGNIVRDDVKLGTLYMLLILATPGQSASENLKQSPLIESARYEVRLLLYRYLKHKFPGLPDRAEEEFNSLLRLLSQLETCKNIHVHGRIHEPTCEQTSVICYASM